MTSASDEVRRLLKRYLTIEISLSELREHFGEDLNYSREGNTYVLRRAPRLEVSVDVTAADILRALDLAARRHISIDELEAWANFVLLFEGFEFVSPITDDGALLQTVHEMASPEIYEPLDEERLLLLKENVSRLQ